MPSYLSVYSDDISKGDVIEINNIIEIDDIELFLQD